MARSLQALINITSIVSHAGEFAHILQLRGKMPGRKKLADHLLKYPRKKPPQKKYNLKTLEPRGVTYKEPLMIKSFWREYGMNQIEQMTDEELYEAIDKFLEGFIYRQKKQKKDWDFPIRPEYLSIDPNWKR